MKNINENEIKLLAFDVDGTLLNSDHQIGVYTLGVLQRLQAKGITITLATGKILLATKPAADQLGLTEPLILANGCVIQYSNGEIIFEACLQRNVVEKIFPICDEMRADLMVYFPEQVVVKEINHNVSLILGYGGPYPQVVNAWCELGERLNRVTKIIAIDRQSTRHLEEIQAALTDTLDGRVNICRTLVPMLEIWPLGVSKATGLKKVAQILNVSMENVIAFGDGDNDVEMLAEAGIGVAVANATQLAKDNADVTVGTNDESGPARFLAEIFNL